MKKPDTQNSEHIMDLMKKSKDFVKANPKIEEALRTFQIAEEQYRLAIQSLQAGTFTSDTTNITIEPESSWMSK